MKKAIILTTLLAISTVTMAKGGDDRHHGGFNDGKARTHQQQGFFDESLAVKTVADALKAKDDTPAMLEGKIVKQIDKDDFIFKDNTGEIEIDVDKRAWNGLNITPQDTIQIRGKVDNDWDKAQVDVKHIIKK